MTDRLYLCGCRTIPAVAESNIVLGQGSPFSWDQALPRVGMQELERLTHGAKGEMCSAFGTTKLWGSYSLWRISFGIDTHSNGRQVYFMGQSERRICPHCGAYLTWALPQGGNTKRTFQCLNCDGPDPMKTERTSGWLKGELQPPK